MFPGQGAGLRVRLPPPSTKGPALPPSALHPLAGVLRPSKSLSPCPPVSMYRSLMVLASGGWAMGDIPHKGPLFSPKAPGRQVRAGHRQPLRRKMKAPPSSPRPPLAFTLWRLGSLMKPVAQRALHRAHRGRVRAETPPSTRAWEEEDLGNWEGPSGSLLSQNKSSRPRKTFGPFFL